MANVSVSNARKDYGAFHAIKGVSVEIGNGEFVVLVGPSGCGKSTLLRMIAGLEGITSGAIQIGPHVVNELPPKDRNIAMVFQNYALYPHMTVAQNMGFALRMKRMPRTDVKARVDRAARILGLEDLLERYPKQLSGGQRQRVAMGRAIVRDPKVFLFDEPLSNLDAKLRVQMRGEIKALHQRLKTTTVYVTHDQVEAMTMADRIVVMRAGIVEQSGTPLELYDNPENIFVAQFIGSPSMNILEGEITDGAFQTSDGVRLPLPGFHLGDGRKISYGIRPEHIRLSDQGIPGTVHLVEPTGATTEVTVVVGNQQITAIAHERLTVRPGQQVMLSIDISKVCLFDADGKRIRVQGN